MKKSSLLVLVVPLLIVGLVVATTVVYKNMKRSPAVETEASSPKSLMPALVGDAGKPSSGFDTPSTQTSTSSDSVSDLSDELDSTYMDDVSDDVGNLEAEAEAL